MKEIIGDTGKDYSKVQLERVDAGDTAYVDGRVQNKDKLALVLRNCVIPEAGILLLTSEDFLESGLPGGYNKLLSSVNALHNAAWKAGYKMEESVPVNSNCPQGRPFFIKSEKDGFNATIRGNASNLIYATGRKKIGMLFKTANPDLEACKQSLTRAYLSGQFNRLQYEMKKLDNTDNSNEKQYLQAHIQNTENMMEVAFEAETPVMKDFIVPSVFPSQMFR